MCCVLIGIKLSKKKISKFHNICWKPRQVLFQFVIIISRFGDCSGFWLLVCVSTRCLLSADNYELLRCFLVTSASLHTATSCGDQRRPHTETRGRVATHSARHPIPQPQQNSLYLFNSSNMGTIEQLDWSVCMWNNNQWMKYWIIIYCCHIKWKMQVMLGYKSTRSNAMSCRKSDAILPR